MNNSYHPFDLRKLAKNPLPNCQFFLHQPSGLISSEIAPSFAKQDESTDLEQLTEIFTPEYRHPEIYTAIIDNVYMTPRCKGLARYWGIFWDNYYAFNFINDDAKQRFSKSGEFIIDEYNEVITLDLTTKHKVHFSGMSVWLYPFNNLDHLLRECLPGLLTLKEMNVDFNQLNFIVNEASSDTLAFLKALSIPQDRIISISNCWLSFDKLIIPCFGSFGHLHTPSRYYSNIATHIAKSLPSKPPLANAGKRIYVSRKNAGVRRILNESALYEGLTERGFTIVEPGDYAKIRQVEMFRDAEIIIGPHGMGIANAIFAENLKLLVEVMQTDWNRVSYFRTAQLKHAHYGAYYVEPLSDSYQPHKTISGDILINRNKFFAFLDNLLRVH